MLIPDDCGFLNIIFSPFLSQSGILIDIRKFVNFDCF